MRFPRRVVIDTNVLIVANDASSQASDECFLESVEFLEHATSNAVVVIDDMFEIVEEYKKYCSFSGQPGVGDRFFVHLYRSQADARRVCKVPIAPDDNGSFEEVPAELEEFDPSDKKFIATVVADGRKSTIVNCVDSDWSLSGAALHKCGISVHELCPSCLKPG